MPVLLLTCRLSVPFTSRKDSSRFDFDRLCYVCSRRFEKVLKPNKVRLLEPTLT